MTVETTPFHKTYKVIVVDYYPIQDVILNVPCEKSESFRNYNSVGAWKIKELNK